MKNNLILFLLMSISFICCQQKESPITDLSQVIEDIKWNDSYSNVKQSFEKKYGLEFEREVKQKDGNIAYKFIGANINGIKTESWIALFTGDTLQVIDIMIFSETDEQNSGKLQNLKNDIESLPFDKQMIDDDFWVLSTDDDTKCGINLVTNQNAIGISIYLSKNFDKYMLTRDIK